MYVVTHKRESGNHSSHSSLNDACIVTAVVRKEERTGMKYFQSMQKNNGYSPSRNEQVDTDRDGVLPSLIGRTRCRTLWTQCMFIRSGEHLRNWRKRSFAKLQLHKEKFSSDSCIFYGMIISIFNLPPNIQSAS